MINGTSSVANVGHRAWLVRLLVALAVVLASGAASAPASASSDTAQAPCNITMDAPHVSSGAGGVIAKLRYCNDSAGQVQTTLYLYLCPNKPSSNESNWYNEGCRSKALETYGWSATAFSNYTRYVPNTGKPGAHGTGWWVACANFSKPFAGMVPSISVYISA
ncbi:hypothetical protein GA0070622_2644 [Micromonospora sediminicola]|uniref:Peptidase inhibitor family I36 n=1 Tax=Micromonospora sediminicola TaxID=946078 RepID=A0A1A9B925_9ACTN|nr:hypothetical protein [Micromonospora sediminicola]SBT65643.1 hypothetical protein GA0070622_2644 [Micromonospora sediminicola]